MIKSITESQKKLLLVLVAVIVVACTWRFGYMYISDRTSEIQEENFTLEGEIENLKSLELQKDIFVQKTAELNADTLNVIGKYGAGNTVEKILLFLSDLSAQSNMIIPSVSFGEESNVTVLSDGTLLSEAGNADTSGGAGTSDDGSADSAAEGSADLQDGTSSDSAEGTDAAGKVTDYYLYDYPVTFEYEVSYSGLKRAMEYIHNYGERMNVESITVSYDENTGRLTGSMTLNMYTMTGTAKSYVQPELNDIDTGVANIFGSVE